MKILIIEDDIGIGFSLRLALEDRSHTVEVFEDPTKVPYDTITADIILLDYYMPKMDGEMALEKIRQSPTLKDVRVIMMSASPQLKDRAQQLNIEHLAKPFDLIALYQVIEA